VIGWLLCLALEVTLRSGNELLVRIVGLLVIIALIVAGSDYDPLGLPLWPPLVAFSAPLCAFAGCLEWCPSTAAEDRPPVALDENGPDCLLTRGVPSGDVVLLLRGLQLIVVELMHQGPTACAEPKCRDDVGIVDLGELVALLGEPPNVILKGLARLMSTTLHIPRVAWPRVCALEVASEDLLEIVPAINQISGQVIEPSPDCVSQVNREKLDDEDVVIHPTHPARKAVIFQPNIGVGFAIIIDDVVWLLEIFWETCIMHVAPKHLGPWALGAEAAPLDRYTRRNMGYVRGARNAPPPPHSLGEPDGVPEARVAWLEAGQNLCR
jgi:hypothetical protein